MSLSREYSKLSKQESPEQVSIGEAIIEPREVDSGTLQGIIGSGQAHKWCEAKRHLKY
jgi:hypothetical protein